jgi:hypothetical protein
MITARENFGMTLLNNGLYLITGGSTSTAPSTNLAEIYDPQDHIYLTYPSQVLPYSGSELLTATIPSGSPIKGPYTWTATYGSFSTTGTTSDLTNTYTYPVAPAIPSPVNGIQPPTPVIAFDTITMTATSGEAVTVTIGLIQ